MRNVLLLLFGLALVAVGTVFATGNPHEVGGPPTQGHTIPFYTTAAGMRFQCMWIQPEIDEKGSVARIEFQYESGGATPTALTGCKMILCHTSKDKLTNDFKKNYDFKTPFEVFSGKYDVPKGLKKDDWFTVCEPDNFTYNNRNNLLFEISWTGATGTTTKVYVSTADQPGRLRAFNAEAETGKLLANWGQVAMVTIGNPAVDPSSLGRVRALFR
jgi:hypothetical protein